MRLRLNESNAIGSLLNWISIKLIQLSNYNYNSIKENDDYIALLRQLRIIGQLGSQRFQLSQQRRDVLLGDAGDVDVADAEEVVDLVQKMFGRRGAFQFSVLHFQLGRQLGSLNTPLERLSNFMSF